MKRLKGQDRYITCDFLPGSAELGLLWPDFIIARITRETIYRAGLTEAGGGIYLDNGVEYARIIDYDALTDSLYVIKATRPKLPYVAFIRLCQSAELTKAYIIRLLSIWGVARYPEYCYPSWRDIHIVGRVYSLVAQKRERREEMA